MLHASFFLNCVNVTAAQRFTVAGVGRAIQGSGLRGQFSTPKLGVICRPASPVTELAGRRLLAKVGVHGILPVIGFKPRHTLPSVVAGPALLPATLHNWALPPAEQVANHSGFATLASVRLSQAFGYRVTKHGVALPGGAALTLSLPFVLAEQLPTHGGLAGLVGSSAVLASAAAASLLACLRCLEACVTPFVARLPRAVLALGSKLVLG